MILFRSNKEFSRETYSKWVENIPDWVFPSVIFIDGSVRVSHVTKVPL